MILTPIIKRAQKREGGEEELMPNKLICEFPARHLSSGSEAPLPRDDVITSTISAVCVAAHAAVSASSLVSIQHCYHSQVKLPANLNS